MTARDIKHVNDGSNCNVLGLADAAKGREDFLQVLAKGLQGVESNVPFPDASISDLEVPAAARMADPLGAGWRWLDPPNPPTDASRIPDAKEE
jgi:hypothetical protein